MSDIIVPLDLWNDDTEGAVSVWYFEDGDQVSEGDILCELMVEKSTFEISANASGRLTIVSQAEDPVSRGGVIARIG